MNEALAMLREAALWSGLLALAMPILFGIWGAQICARAGVINLGAEGTVALGAVAASLASLQGHGAWAALGLAAASGMAPGLLIGMLGSRRAAAMLAGLGVTLAVLAILPMVDVKPPSAPFTPVTLPYLADLPQVGAALATALAQMPTVHLAIVMLLVLLFLMHRTPLGLAIRACGDNPAALAAQGRSPGRIRTAAVMLGSVLLALAGAAPVMTAMAMPSPGRGLVYVALALLMGGRLVLAVGAALVLALIDIGVARLPDAFGFTVPPSVGAIWPLVLALMLLAGTGRAGAAARATAR